MKHEEKVINGVLHYRAPNGIWYPYTAEQLTVKLMESHAGNWRHNDPLKYVGGLS